MLSSVRIPFLAASDKEAIQLCIRTCTGINREDPRVIRIPNSLHVGRIMLSRAYYDDVLAGRWPGVRPCSQPEELRFVKSGTQLIPLG